jgi:AraC family transcriptional regulator
MTIALRGGSFFGDTVSVVSAGAVLSEVRHATGRTVPPHTHEFPYFSLLVEGAYRETSAGVTINYDPFTVVFHAAGKEHTDTIGPTGARFFMIELLERWTKGTEGEILPQHFTEMHGGNAAWLMSRLYHEFLAAATTELTVEALLYELCATAIDPSELPGTEPTWMADLDKTLQRNLCENVSVRSLADTVGVNASHLCRAFHRFRRRTIGDYVAGLRMQLVCRRIVETDLPMSDIAAEAGFADQSHMTRIFKRFVGQTPGAYRRRIQKGFAERPSREKAKIKPAKSNSRAPRMRR